MLDYLDLMTSMKKVDAIDPIEFITKKVSSIFQILLDWFVLAFKDPIGGLRCLLKGYIDCVTLILLDLSIRKPLNLLMIGWMDDPNVEDASKGK